MSTPAPTPQPGSNNLQTIGTDINLALTLVTGVVKATSGNSATTAIASAASIVAAGLTALLQHHGMDITFGELESLRLKQEWPDAGGPVIPPIVQAPEVKP